MSLKSDHDSRVHFMVENSGNVPWLTLMVFSSKIHALVAILEQFFCQSVRLYAPQIKRAQLSDLHLNGQDRGEPHSCAIMTANMLSPYSYTAK